MLKTFTIGGGVSFLWLLNKHTCISHSTKESKFQALTTTKKEQLILGDMVAIIFVRLSNNLANTFTRGLERDFDWIWNLSSRILEIQPYANILILIFSKQYRQDRSISWKVRFMKRKSLVYIFLPIFPPFVRTYKK